MLTDRQVMKSSQHSLARLLYCAASLLLGTLHRSVRMIYRRRSVESKSYGPRGTTRVTTASSLAYVCKLNSTGERFLCSIGEQSCRARVARGSLGFANKRPRRGEPCRAAPRATKNNRLAGVAICPVGKTHVRNAYCCGVRARCIKVPPSRIFQWYQYKCELMNVPLNS